MMEGNSEHIAATLTKGFEPKISVVGCGGAGNNIVHSIYWSNKNVETIAVNTDESKLERVDAHKKVLIGKDVTHGQGAGGFPEVGECCAEKAKSTIESMLKGSDIVFIIAGMGGGTGTGAAPVIAEVAKNLNAVTFAIAINPFSYEKNRQVTAKEGITKLRKVAENTIVLDNDRLLQIAGDINVNESFSIMERSINKIIDSVSSKITESFMIQFREEVAETLRHGDHCIEIVAQPMVSPMAEIISVAAPMAEMAFSASITPEQLLSR
jgi:cell division protein FtsZ